MHAFVLRKLPSSLPTVQYINITKIIKYPFSHTTIHSAHISDTYSIMARNSLFLYEHMISMMFMATIALHAAIMVWITVIIPSYGFATFVWLTVFIASIVLFAIYPKINNSSKLGFVTLLSLFLWVLYFGGLLSYFTTPTDKTVQSRHLDFLYCIYEAQLTMWSVCGFGVLLIKAWVRHWRGLPIQPEKPKTLEDGPDKTVEPSKATNGVGTALKYCREAQADRTTD